MSIRLKKPKRSSVAWIVAGLGAAIAALAIAIVWPHSSPAPTAPAALPAEQLPAQNPAPPAPLAESDPVLELFNPSQASLSEQLSEAALKSRLEEAMTTSFILKRCGMVNDSEYSNTYQALMLYARRMQPTLSDQEIQDGFRATVASASASYGLIYARVSCDTPPLQTAAAQLAQWREAILKQPQQ